MFDFPTITEHRSDFDMAEKQFVLFSVFSCGITLSANKTDAVSTRKQRR